MHIPIRQIAERLAENAEAVCRYYLSNGQKNGRFWVVGDVFNTKGRSMYVRLTGPTYGAGAAGKWTDAATGEHGDLLDIIQASLNISSQEAREEALRFLSLPAQPAKQHEPSAPVPSNSTPAAQRLFAASKPISGTLGAAYLRSRAITCSLDLPALRFHPNCYLLAANGDRSSHPAIIAAITDNAGTITGVLRSYLANDGAAKAPLEDPRRSLGNVLGNAIRIGAVQNVLAAGEGLETMLSLRSLLPELPVAACTSANHLAAFIPPPGLQRLYIAHDHGPAGLAAALKLEAIADAHGIPHARLTPPGDDDWNAAIMGHGASALLPALMAQLQSADIIHLAPKLKAQP